jgi:hypothetical protein
MTRSEAESSVANYFSLHQHNTSEKFIIHSLGVEMENVLKINAGYACSDRANEVDPRPNGVKKHSVRHKFSCSND